MQQGCVLGETLSLRAPLFSMLHRLFDIPNANSDINTSFTSIKTVGVEFAVLA